MQMRPILFQKSASALLYQDYMLKSPKDVEMAKVLLNTYGDTLTNNTVQELIERLAVIKAGVVVNFIKADLIIEPLCLNLLEECEEVARFCKSVNLTIGRRVETGGIDKRCPSIDVSSFERLTLKVSLQNMVSTSFTLSNLSLEMISAGGDQILMPSMGTETIILPELGNCSVIIQFHADFVGDYSPSRIISKINDNVLALIPVTYRQFQSNRTLHNASDQVPTLHRDLDAGARMQISLEEFPDAVFCHQEIQFQAKVTNIGTKTASEVVLFADGIPSFPVLGVRLGTVCPGSSIDIPLSFHIDSAEAFRITLLAAADSNTKVAGIFSINITPEIGPEVSFLGQESQQAILRLTNLSTAYLLNLSLEYDISEGKFEKPRQVCPFSIDIPPSQSCFFCLDDFPLLHSAESIIISLDCLISGQPTRFVSKVFCYHSLLSTLKTIDTSLHEVQQLYEELPEILIAKVSPSFDIQSTALDQVRALGRSSRRKAFNYGTFIKSTFVDNDRISLLIG